MSPRGRKQKSSRSDVVETKDDNGILYIGIDFGTARTSISASNDIKRTIKSVVGWPKDVIAKKFLKQPILFGDEALKNRLALDIYRPLEKGVIKDTAKDMEAAKELIKYAIELAKGSEKYKQIYGVIGAPALTDHVNKQALTATAHEVLDAAMVVSEPFAVAYGLNKLNNALVVDIGAGTVDLCRMHGTLPSEEDEASLVKAGDHIDVTLFDSIRKRYKGAQITINMVQEWKEAHGFVGKENSPISVDFPMAGRSNSVEITTEIRKACESIAPDILDTLKHMISSYDPEFQDEIRNNIILAGGCSQIKNLKDYMENHMKSIGG
ncbi:MAG: rod shape-determining protein, partial [Thermoplasmata archaeon]|nr:rod shape-determining protein [Thermoplasmata archaeon]